LIDQARWRRAKDEHEVAVAAFVAAARAVPDSRWNEPPGAAKWSPAQIVEHVRLTYATVSRELRGDAGFRVRVGPLRRLLLRWTVLRRLRRDRAFPPGAPAVREVRPAGGPFERQATLAGVEAEASGFAALIEGRRDLPATGITHPFFGKLDQLGGLELMTLHTGHHGAQLDAPAAAGADRADPARS
jgi:hypothetical protein